MYKIMEHKATATAGSNIAFIKYWGQRDSDLNIPLNNSISLTLDAAATVTTVQFHGDLAVDELVLNGSPASEEVRTRASRHLDHLRVLAGVNLKARIETRNNFPASAGIASSASGFAALTVAAACALGLDSSQEDLSRLARLGSGSACRSLFGGIVEWETGTMHEESFAREIAPPDHWDLVDVIAIVSTAEKQVSSSTGQRLAQTSPYLEARLQEVNTLLPLVRQAIAEKHLAVLGESIEAEALSMHAVMMTSTPSLLYWNEGTIALLHRIRQWRNEGLPAYFTIDAGPNVHIITERRFLPDLLEQMQNVPEVTQSIVCGPGEGARLLSEHLF
jgi:diphosphomevalonate decarboxylase